ncbi:hypothetical protein C8Q80DRAFT_874975 [Daedaleopsis nitida]|nr:hypothetical protein C8Q80DRAFT_874975 [Daedaleopsis nitida]
MATPPLPPLMPSESALEIIEFTERIAGDIAHAVPVAGALVGYGSQKLSKKTITMILQAGQVHLHKVSQALLDPENLEALQHINAYGMFSTKHVGLVEALEDIRQQVYVVKMYQILQKRRLYNLSVRKTREALEFKLDVWTKSDIARLQLQDARLHASTVPNHPSTSIPPARLTSPSEVTLVSLAPRRSLTFPPPGDTNYDSDDACSVYSATSSMHGNPWLNHVVPESSSQSNNVETMAPLPSARDKGKGRAVAIEAKG